MCVKNVPENVQKMIPRWLEGESQGRKRTKKGESVAKAFHFTALQIVAERLNLKA